MKVCVIAGYAPSLVNFRGPLLRAMRACGHEVCALAPGGPEAAGVGETLRSWGVGFRPVRLSRRGLNPVTDLRAVADIRTALEEERAELVLSYTIKPVIFGSFAARRAGVEHIYSLITGLGRAFEGVGLAAWVLSGLVRGLYRGALGFNARVFFQNRDDENYFRENGMLAEDTPSAVTFGTGVDLEQFPRQALPLGPPLFLCMARLLREKGVAEFAEAARAVRREHPEARFRLLGPLERGAGALSEAEVRGWVREGLLEYPGEVRDVRPHLAEASVVVLPSYYGEGLPRSLQEAAATGRAVVTTDHPGCRDAVIPGKSGLLVPVRNVSALSEALKRFILEPKLAARMGLAARGLAEERFDVRRINDILLRGMGLC
ncbi:MAG: glycosyltransferase family 4 protein [Desulfovibrio sp.]